MYELDNSREAKPIKNSQRTHETRLVCVRRLTFPPPPPIKRHDCHSIANQIWRRAHNIKLMNVCGCCCRLVRHWRRHTSPLPLVREMKVLGVVLSEKLTWNAHINYITAKANRRFFLLRRLKPVLNMEDLHNVYCAMMRSLLEYACPVFVGLGKTLETKLQKLDNRAHRLIYNQRHSYSLSQTCRCQPDSLRQRRHAQSLGLFRAITKARNHILKSSLPRMGRRRFLLEFNRTAKRQSSFIPFCCQLWNASLCF